MLPTFSFLLHYSVVCYGLSQPIQRNKCYFGLLPLIVQMVTCWLVQGDQKVSVYLTSVLSSSCVQKVFDQAV